MAAAVFIVTFILSLAILAYHGAGLSLFVVISSLFMLVGSFFGLVSYLSWAVFLLIVLPLTLSGLRRYGISKPLLALFTAKMPDMSLTEKEAIDAGTVWWDGELFRGKPNWYKLHDIPPPRLSIEENAFLNGPVNQLCRQINDFEITHELAELPEPIWQQLKDDKFFAMAMHKEYGGLGFSAYAQSLVLQKLAGVSGVVCTVVGVPNSLGPGELLQQYGTSAQKNHYLPRLADGRDIPCFALTSPEAGSDAGAIPDEGVVTYGHWQGEKVLGIRVNWNKRYITLAPVATVIGLAFKLRDPDALLGTQEEIGITCALIPVHLDGIQIGRRHFPLNMPFPNGPTQGKNVFIPLDFIIGGAEMVGQGWRMLMECLSIGRGITLPANSTGSSKTAALAVGAYSRIRHQFKIPIGKMEGIEAPLARLAGNLYVMDAASSFTVTGIDMGEKPSVISAIVKYHCTHRNQQNMIDAMDILGGKGICMGPKNFIARSYQGAPIAVTVEGANILTRSMIIFGQGAMRCHPFLLSEIQAAYHTDKEQSLAMFDTAIFGHAGFVISNVIRSFWLGLTDGRYSVSPRKNAIFRYYQQMNRYCANFALLADVAVATLGANLKRKERLSARLSDVLSQLYLTACTLKRFDDDGALDADLPLVHWGAQNALYQAEQAMLSFLDNFPHQGTASVLKAVIFPFGAQRKPPSDALESALAKILQTPNESRTRLGRHAFLEDSAHHPAGQIEHALPIILRAELVHKKLCHALGEHLPFMYLDKLAKRGIEEDILDEKEARILMHAEKARLATINVDDFSLQQLAASEPKPSAVLRKNIA